MKKSVALLLSMLLVTFIYFILSNSQKKEQTVTPFSQETYNLDQEIWVPKNLSALYLSDITETEHTIYMSNSPFTLIVIGDPECNACDSLLEDIYKNEIELIKKDIDINFLWLYAGNDLNDFIRTVEKKINNYLDYTTRHLIIPTIQYTNIGFKKGPLPLIAIYNQDNELLFQSYGYSERMVEKILRVDEFTELYIY